MAKKSKLKLKPGVTIGQPAAEDDRQYLESAFVNHPAITALKDAKSHQSILLGRTGAGKSAILWHIENSEKNVSRVEPKDIAFQYVGNSAIIQQVTELGVDLHTLYEYLWTHVLALHVTREFVGVDGSSGLGSIISTIKETVWGNPKRQMAVKYLNDHANDFWLSVEQVSTEITDAMTSKLATEAGLSSEVFRAKVEGGADWKEEQRRLFKHRAQDVVSGLQIRELKETVNALADCLDERRSYYILIDDLDREWAGSEAVQYALIRALIESLKTFRRIPGLKIIVAMREDLFEAVLRTTSDKHFQAEKLEGSIKRLRWSDALLSSVVEQRIQQLYRFEYTKQQVSISDVLPPSVAQLALRQYLIKHTLRRPRDIIAFVNTVLAQNEGVTLPLPARAITKAEPMHSGARLRALEDEWRSCHPLIRTYLGSLQGVSGHTAIGSLDEDKLFTLVFEVDELKRNLVDEVERRALVVYDRNKELSFKRLARALVACLYKVGAVGLKLDASKPFMFCHDHRATVEDAELADDMRFVVHDMLASALGCQPSKAEAEAA